MTFHLASLRIVSRGATAEAGDAKAHLAKTGMLGERACIRRRHHPHNVEQLDHCPFPRDTTRMRSSKGREHLTGIFNAIQPRLQRIKSRFSTPFDRALLFIYF